MHALVRPSFVWLYVERHLQNTKSASARENLQDWLLHSEMSTWSFIVLVHYLFLIDSRYDRYA